jgi:NAD(P)-dependent dehydrogenase (short-subunit alcohol dehydrogenase family)
MSTTRSRAETIATSTEHRSPAPTALMMEASPLEGKRALIIGGTSGIGRAVAAKLAILGAELVVVGRDSAKAGGVADELDGVVMTLARDAHEAGVAEALLERGRRGDHVVRTFSGSSKQFDTGTPARLASPP